MFGWKNLYLLIKSKWDTATIEDVMDNIDKEDFERHLLGYLRMDLARAGFFETYVKPYAL